MTRYRRFKGKNITKKDECKNFLITFYTNNNNKNNKHNIVLFSAKPEMKYIDERAQKYLSHSFWFCFFFCIHLNFHRNRKYFLHFYFFFFFYSFCIYFTLIANLYLSEWFLLHSIIWIFVLSASIGCEQIRFNSKFFLSFLVSFLESETCMIASIFFYWTMRQIQRWNTYMWKFLLFTINFFALVFLMRVLYHSFHFFLIIFVFAKSISIFLDK